MSRELQFHITGVDCNPDAPGFHFADRSLVCPRADEDAFIPFVRELCRNERIDLVFSLVTAELPKLAAHREELRKAGTRIPVSDAETIRDTVHKASLYGRLRAMGVAVPDYRVVRNAADLRKAIRELGYPARPVCFKPTFGDGSRGFRVLDANRDRHSQIFREKPNSVYLAYSELCEALDGDPDIPELLVMEYLPHEEYSVDLLADEGDVIVAVPRLREQTTGGITTRSVIRDEPDVVAYAAHIVGLMKLHGIVGVQVRRDAARNPKIVEINPRIQGTIVHCTAAGINFPLLAVKRALGLPISEAELKVQWGTKMVRYWEEVFFRADGSSYVL
jgi:carbamoyl-phosphate synthase large subunit